MFSKIRFNLKNIFPHILAITIASTYAWQISISPFVKTGLQFVAPLLMIMLTHFIWIAFGNNLTYGFSHIVFKRTLQSTLILAGAIIIFSIYAPMPAQAGDLGDTVISILIIIVCLAVIVGIVAITAIFLNLAFSLASAAKRSFRKKHSDKNENRFFDFGSVAIASAAILIASFEGLPAFYSFDAHDSSTASEYIDASPDKVWKTLEVATSPEFHLPKVLHIFPQPVAVLRDEGIELNSIRIVRIEGREGGGNLTLKVISRDNNSVTFDVLQDTSPIGGWIRHRSLTYRVFSENSATRLDVTLEYERLLAPAWFFKPTMNLSAYLAMDVLARDVRKFPVKKPFSDLGKISV